MIPPRSRALLAAALLAVLAAPDAHASSGGTSAPPPGTPPVAAAPSGGVQPGNPATVPPRRHSTSRRRHASRAPVLSSFSVSRSKIYAYGAPARVSFEIDARTKTVPVSLDIYAGGSRVRTVSLGDTPTGSAQSYLLRGESLPMGELTVRIRSPHLRRGARASASGAVAVYDHRFPLIGSFTWPGAGGKFGAGRAGHIHQGFDLLAPQGTPIVAPRGGTVKYVDYQAGGAGYYVVVSGAGDDYDYAFMHIAAGTTRVHPGQKIQTGQRIGDVGATGDASGPHLHFEMWRGPWANGGTPIDPEPFLRRWNSWS